MYRYNLNYLFLPLGLGVTIELKDTSGIFKLKHQQLFLGTGECSVRSHKQRSDKQRSDLSTFDDAAVVLTEHGC